MTPEDWQAGMQNEADSVPDRAWARETRWAAWRHERRLEIRRAITWGTLGTLLPLVAAPLLIWIPVSLPPELFFPFHRFTLALQDQTLIHLLLLVWTARYAWSGQAPWVLAALASLAPPLYFALLQLLAMSKDASLPAMLLKPLLLSSILQFCLFAAVAWAIYQLRQLGNYRRSA